MISELFTIGYSPHTISSFTDLLKKYNISSVVDVRSSPYSQFKPEFNRDKIKEYLKLDNITYVFLGDSCGARVTDPSCLSHGRVDYSLVAESQKFKEGLERIRKGMQKYRIALMCAEKDPITCHRTILVCRNLRSNDIEIKHILSNGRIEEHKDSEYRLMKLHNLEEPDIFRSEQCRLDDAYTLQGQKIAYEAGETNNENGG